jgi:hypothetical protein
MQGDACDRVVAGVTTLREVQRIIYFDTMTTKAKHAAPTSSGENSDEEPPTLKLAA